MIRVSKRENKEARGAGKDNTMKILKTAEQKNVEVNEEMYTEAELEEMKAAGEITSLHDEFPDVKSLNDATEPIVFTEKCKELKVIYNKEFGGYETVAVLLTGKAIYIKL